MGYRAAMEAAGAKVHSMNHFGSYQGDWFALVTYEGQTGWVHGSFGSCTHCDAFQAEMDYDDEDRGCADHTYDYDQTCHDCLIHAVEYRARLARFGKSYLDDLQTVTQIHKVLKDRFSWDSESRVAYNWVRAEQRNWETFKS